MNVTTSRPINLIVIHCTASRCDRGHNARSIDIAYKGGLLPDGTPANTRTAARRGALLRLLRQLLGSFRVAISTEGVEVAEKFTAANIKKARIVFTPCKELKNLCKTFEYRKTSTVATRGQGGANEGEDNTTGGGGNDGDQSENPLG